MPPTSAHPPLVSVCVPTYNGAAHLAEALYSIVAQTYPSLEVIICDDGSTDATLDIARLFAIECPHPVLLIEGERLGAVHNWNRCAAEARGQFIKFLFQDDTLEAECIAALI